MTTKTSLQSAIKTAVQLLRLSSDAESGGVILRKGDVYQFIPCVNESTTPTCIYSPIMDTVFQMINDDPEWVMYASVHNHPYWSSNPSRIDQEELFQSFPKNYIYSNLSNTLAEYDINSTVHYVNKV